MVDGFGLTKWELPLNSETIYSIRPISIENFNVLIKNIIRILTKEGFKSEDFELYEQKVVRDVHIFKLKKFIRYVKKEN